MLHSPDDVAAPRVAARTGPTDHARGHRDHRARHLLAVQPDPGHERGPSRDRRERHFGDLRSRAGRRPAPVHPAAPGRCRGRRLRARGRVPARAASRARSDRAGRFVCLARLARRPARGRPGGRGRRARRDAPGRGGIRRAHRHRAGDGPGGDRRDRRDGPRRSLRRPPGGDLHAARGAPRRRRDHPRRGHPRRRRGAPALRDHARCGALRDTASGGARDHGADGRAGGGRLGGDRPGEHRGASAHPAEPR